MEYGWLILTMTVLFLCVFTIGIYIFRGRILLANRLLLILGAFALIASIGKYVSYALEGEFLHYPVDFSFLTCIVFGIVVLTDKKKLVYPFVSFAAFMCGIFYNLLIFIGQDTFINAMVQSGTVGFLLEIFINDALLLGSLLMMGNFRFDHKTIWQIPLGSLIFVGWSFIAKYLLYYDYNLYVVRLFEGTIFNNVWDTEHPEILSSANFLPVYYVVLATVLLLFVVVVYGLNYFIYKKDREDFYCLDEEEEY